MAVLDRIGGTPRVYRWLLALSVVLMASPLALTIGAYDAVASSRSWVASVSGAVDSLAALRHTAEETGDPQLPAYEASVAERRIELARARRRLERAQLSAAGLWRITGRGPLLLAAGCALALLGLRLRRFERYAE